MSRRILALDFGASYTGWAHSNGTSGVFDLRIKRDESGGFRLVRFESKLVEVIRGIGVDVIAFEAVSSGGPHSRIDTVRVQSKLQAVVEMLAEVTDRLECCSRYANEIKAHAIPQKKAKRDKDAMMAAATKRWPDVEIIDDNHADALWLLDLIQTELVETK